MRLCSGGCLIAFAVFSAAAPLPAFAAKLTDKEHTRIDYPRPQSVPGDAVLEGAGAVVGEIVIETRNIFDESDARESNGLFRLANHLHVRTKPSTIRAQLLFASGEPYLGRKLQETEAIVGASKTGKVGDGKIFVTDILRVLRIRTGESDNAAL